MSQLMDSPETPPQPWAEAFDEESPIQELRTTISNRDFND